MIKNIKKKGIMIKNIKKKRKVKRIVIKDFNAYWKLKQIKQKSCPKLIKAS